MKAIRNLTIILSLMILSSCQYDPYAGDDTTQRPKFTDVLGTYKFEQQTVYDSTSDSYKTATIILNADGNYRATNIPNLVNDAKNKATGPISTTGKWDIETIAEIDNGFGHPKPHWGIRLSNITESLTYVGFMGDSPPYKLIIEYSDPDLGEVMIFSKK